MRPDLATMSDSSFNALICSLTARRIAVVDSLASTGMSIAPFFNSARVSSNSPRIDWAVRRISSVASEKRLRRRFDHLVDRIADLVGQFQRPSLGLLQCRTDQVLERLHHALELLGLVHQPDGEVFQRRLPLQRVLEVRLRRADQVRRVGKQPAVLVEAVGDRRDLAQRCLRQLGEAVGVGVDEARGSGKGLRRLLGRGGELVGRSRQLLVDDRAGSPWPLR